MRDHYYLMDTDTRPRRLKLAQNRGGFTLGTDDRIALFPETARVIMTIANLAATKTSISARRPGVSTRARLSAAFEWAGDERWMLIEGAHDFLARRHALAS
ncbi:hypothetical protein GPOL_174p01550 (plasmid) [Gordonia polyisoprenivorans VH2]|uniref:Uncharacterized protein n=1 Tax=Gordonia polyisoprenivorans (strain DSM 44266 / VH2) TaxID=1112204 RepID=H6N5C9_GORPV|nr:hypothetical protein GPOL_174p01550 [Gordonia polyisoprenivorans VH2]